MSHARSLLVATIAPCAAMALAFSTLERLRTHVL
nr:MAG TPA: hypothetical protein [Caudoviricetes sp.]